MPEPIVRIERVRIEDEGEGEEKQFIVLWDEIEVTEDGKEKAKRRQKSFPSRLEAEKYKALKEQSSGSATYVEQRAGQELPWKQALAVYTTATFVSDGNPVVQIASGTQCDLATQEMLRAKIPHLVVDTTNLRALDATREALRKGGVDLEVNVIGGTLLPALDSLVGDDAARNVQRSDIRPGVVIMSAKYVWLDQKVVLDQKEETLVLGLHFAEQRSTQRAYATRKTKTRLCVFDHTKIAKPVGYAVEIPIKEVVDSCERCVLVTSLPNESPERSGPRKLRDAHAQLPRALREKVELHFVNLEGERVEAFE